MLLTKKKFSEYTEQDIYEQLRKKLRPYEKSCICDFIISANAKLM